MVLSLIHKQAYHQVAAMTLKNTYKQNDPVTCMEILLTSIKEKEGRERDAQHSDEKNKGVQKLYLFLMPLRIKKEHTYITLKDSNNNNSIPFLLR